MRWTAGACQNRYRQFRPSAEKPPQSAQSAESIGCSIKRQPTVARQKQSPIMRDWMVLIARVTGEEASGEFL